VLEQCGENVFCSLETNSIAAPDQCRDALSAAGFEIRNAGGAMLRLTIARGSAPRRRQGTRLND
jgi:hypothetical protein